MLRVTSAGTYRPRTGQLRRSSLLADAAINIAPVLKIETSANPSERRFRTSEDEAVANGPTPAAQSPSASIAAGGRSEDSKLPSAFKAGAALRIVVMFSSRVTKPQ
jgi:hypothetical protein